LNVSPDPRGGETKIPEIITNWTVVPPTVAGKHKTVKSVN